MNFNRALERDWIPDWAIRTGIRHLLRTRLREQRGLPESQRAAFIEQLRHSPLALETDAANHQHYEVPPEFFQLVLGTHRKYSCGLWNEGINDLYAAEEAMLDLTCRRAVLEDAQDILELGCGWGSLSLYMARRFPYARILAVSNSRSQKRFIDAEAARAGLRNLEVVTADMIDFDPRGKFDRVVSVEMFEHMRNYEELLRRISGWLHPDGLLFVHIFCHREFAYPFEANGPGDWMARHFFSGGMMPSDGLLLNFNDNLCVRGRWQVSGLHYWRTAEAWLERLERNRSAVLKLFNQSLDPPEALATLVRWRVFFMACAELFRFNAGNEWFVSHYLLEHAAVTKNAPSQHGGASAVQEAAWQPPR
jgi:cyclopropane-fatty-acyl-phospholipid synthase